MDGFTERTRAAAAWQIAADLVRRHGQGPHRLTVLENRSAGGGQYHLITLLTPHPTPEQAVLMNIASGNMTPTFPGQPSPFGTPRAPDLGAWARDRDEACLFARALFAAPHRLDVVRAYEAMVGLPARPPKHPMNRPALAIRVMAEVAARSLFGGPEVAWASAATDSPHASGLQPEVERFPAMRRFIPDWDKVPYGEGLWSWWLLRVDHPTGARTPLVISPEAWLHTPAGEAIDLFALFERHARTDEAVRAVLERGPGLR